MLIVTDWTTYTAILLGQMYINGLLHWMKTCMYPSLAHLPSFSALSMIYEARWIIFSFVMLFAIFEKVNKERFVINYTNERTRKVLLQILD